MILRQFISFCLFSLLSTHAFAGRQALVIGNAAYSELAPLRNTHADAEGYADAFEALGFAVTYLTDLGEDALEEAVISFVDGIAPGDEVAFVYAGHGWSANGINYLIPVDAPKQASARLLARRSLALKNGISGVLDEIAAQGAALSLAIIDACRDNPFEGSGTRSAANARGLARIEPLQGSFVIYSAGEGQTALDRLAGDGPEQKYSVFSRHFLPLLTSDMYLEDAVIEAQERTATDARRQDHLQIPAVYRQKLGKTCLAGNCGRVSTAAPTPPADGAPVDHTGWTVEMRVSGEKGLHHYGDPVVAPDGSSVVQLRGYSVYENGEFVSLERFLERFDGAGNLMWSKKLESGQDYIHEGPGGQPLLLSYDRFWLVDENGTIARAKGFVGGAVRLVNRSVPVSATRMRLYGKNTEDYEGPDAVFDLDLNTGVVHDAVFNKVVDYRPVHFESSGHFAISYLVNQDARDISVHAPDGSQLFAVDASAEGRHGLQATTGPLGLYLLYRTDEQTKEWSAEFTLMIKEWSGRETHRIIGLSRVPYFPERVWPTVNEHGLILTYDGEGKTMVERFDMSGQALLWTAEVPGYAQGFNFPWNVQSLSDGGAFVSTHLKTPFDPVPDGKDAIRLIRIGSQGQVKEPEVLE